MPVIPENIQLLNMSYNNEEFETVKGILNLANYKRSLYATDLESFFPSKPNKYSWVKSELDYKTAMIFFNNRTQNEETIRYIVIDDNNEELINISVTIEEFITTILRNGDMAYSLSIKEFREVV